MQFYASFAHNLEFDETRRPSNVSKPTLDIKSSAFSTAEEEEEHCGKRGQLLISLHLLLYLCCTAKQCRELSRADADLS